MKFERTYQVEIPPEPAMDWEEYERIIMTEWETLLHGEPSESVVQSFLERHPSMVPGAFQLLGKSGHGPHLCGLISQPPLPSYDRRVPDFMWLSTNSDTDEPVLIEIEAPNKRWFTESGMQTAHLTQALNQIAEWKAWFGVPHNVEAFKSFYGLDREAWYRRRFRPSYLLIYGRRVEANARPSLVEKRSRLYADDIVAMTYDRLRPDPNCEQLVCLKPNVKGAFAAKSVPPTLKWLPGFAKDRALIGGFEDAIMANEYIPHARKLFLSRRLTYWNTWAMQEGRGIVRSEDEE